MRFPWRSGADNGNDVAFYLAGLALNVINIAILAL